MLELQQIRAQLLFTDSNVVTMATVFDLPAKVSSEDLTASWNLSVSVFFFFFFFFCSFINRVCSFINRGVWPIGLCGKLPHNPLGSTTPVDKTGNPWIERLEI